MVPTNGSNQGKEVLAGESARFSALGPRRTETLSSEEVVKKICFSSGCDVGSLPTSGDINVSDQEYLDQLIREKSDLRFLHAAPLRNLTRLVDKEIARVVAAISAKAHMDQIAREEERGEKVILSEMILVPVDRYPRYNFVGRILGPRGLTAKQLEEDTGCKIMVRGRGSSRTGTSRRERTTDGEPLHVLIQCEDYENRAQKKMRNAVEAINQLLNPPPEGKDELKRKQLIELSIINGTYRPTSATKVALQASRHAPASHMPPMVDNPIYNEQSRLFTQVADAVKHGRKNNVEEQCGSLAQIFGHLNPLHANNVNQNYYDYYRNLLSCTLADPNIMAQVVQSLDIYGMGNRMAMQHTSQHQQHVTGQPGTSGQIPEADFYQFLTAAAMLNSVPFTNGGSGDGPKNNISNTV